MEDRMKITVFVPTGEVRTSKPDEWIFDNCTLPYFQQAPPGVDSKWPIFTRHEIEAPDDANTLTIQSRGSCQTPPAIHIPIPQPKKKVKKWQWIVITIDPLDRPRAEITRWMSCQEAISYGYQFEDRIEKTRIEVEE
jgi:hypothetical protein